MSKHKSAPAPEESVVVNVVPLVDIMFLLLLFLMIGGDMSHREAAELQLPQAEKAREQKADVGPDERYCVVNIAPIKEAKSEAERDEQWFREKGNWDFSIGGIHYPDYFALLEQLNVVSQTKLEETPLPGTQKFLSAVFVTVRADKSAPYELIQNAMQACAEASIYKIEVGAAKPAK